jgi:hypothetical protein
MPTIGNAARRAGAAAAGGFVAECDFRLAGFANRIGVRLTG